MTFPVPSLAYLPRIDIPGEKRSRGIGVLEVATKAGQRVTLPLARVEIAARVAERIAEVTVAETFRNPHAEHLEATYIFPLPGGAAVSDFELKVGARTIKGEVEERGEARRQYQQALDQGKRAALLEQERDDVFTVQVGNLPPGEEVSVRIVYSERLPYFEDGTTEIRLPLVVAPRYVGGAPLGRDSVGDGVELDTDKIPDASRISPPRLAPGFDPKVSLGIEVELIRDAAAGDGEVRDLCCSQHATRTASGAGGVKVALAREDEPLDRDFVLRWRVAGDALAPDFLVHRNGDGAAYGVLSLFPPRRDGFLGVARDVVFVVDRSGSMEGVKMASAARACAILLATLGPRDRFAVQAFDNQVEWLAERDGRRFFRADEAEIARGEKYLRGIESRGGTELDQALGAALGALRELKEESGRVPVVVILTDGQVGDESSALKRVQKTLGDARVFTVGIDTAVNEGFLTRLAALGGGTATFVQPGEALEEALRAVGREIGSPLVTDVTIEDVDAGLDAGSIAPSSVPDLFAGRATTAFFRARKAGFVRVRGKLADGLRYEESVKAREVALPAIGHLWARARVRDLEDRFRLEPNDARKAEIKKEIVDLAVRHKLLTRFTAFVVVDESEVVNEKGERRKVVQPVEMPARWEMQAEAAAAKSTRLMSMASGFLAAPAGYGAPCAPPPPAVAPGAPPPRAARAAGYLTQKEYVAFQDSDMMRRAAPGAAGGPASAPVGAPAGGGPGLFGRLAKKLRAAVSKESKAEASKDAEPAPVSKADRKAAENALEAFAKAFADARAEVEAGRVPGADPLEKARKELVEALTGSSDLGTRVPLLQRFLRGAAVELVAALKSPGIDAAGLRPLFERHAKAFEEARAEAAPHVVAGAPHPNPLPGGEGSFWETSV